MARVKKVKVKPSEQFPMGWYWYLCEKVEGRETGRHIPQPKLTDRRASEQALRRWLATQEGPRPIDPFTAVDRFLSYLRTIKRRSPETIAYYDRKLRALTDWMTARRVIANWNRALFEDYIAAHPEWSARSVQMAISCARHWLKWAKSSGYRIPDFVGDLTAPTVRPQKRTPFKAGEIDRLIAMLQAERHWLLAPVSLAAYAALSLSDLYAITWDNVDLERGLITMERSKTGIPIRVPIAPQLQAVLESLPTLRKGPVCRNLPQHKTASLKALKSALKRAGVEFDTVGTNGWHRFRHDLGTRLMQARVPVRMIGAILAHAPGSRVTAQYQHPDDDDLRAAISQASGV